MRSIILLITLVLLIPTLGLAQQIINGSIMHDGGERSYILYVPANYTGDEPVPLLFDFHGFTSTADYQMARSNFPPIADTAGFILVTPQGTTWFGQSHWNVGGWIIGSSTDDVDFTDHLLDSLSSNYNIDPSRVYATGFSNGGFMSFLLACQLSDRIAAIASVSGSMTPENYDACASERALPILQIHGTADGTIPYDGIGYSKPVAEVIDYWVVNDNTVDTAIVTSLPDIDPGDGSTVEHHLYDAGDNGVTVEHFKVLGGDHHWPGAEGNMDIGASDEIWRFLSRYDIDGLIVTSCCEIRGDINHNGAPEPDISDLIYLVNFMFQEGPDLPCGEEANVDGLGNPDIPDISDLIYIVSYMFQDGPSLVPCL